MRRINLLTFLVVVGSVGVARGDYVANGDFETHDISGWTWFPDASMSDVVMFDVYGGDGASFAFQVNPKLATGRTVGSLTQWLILEGGTSYTVSWEQGMQNIGPYLGDSGTIEFSLGRRLLSRWSQGVLGANGHDGVSETRVFTPSVTDTYELNFSFFRAGSYGDSTVFMYIDNVSVVDPTAVLVPTPSALVSLLGLGMTVTGIGWWRKRKQ